MLLTQGRLARRHVVSVLGAVGVGALTLLFWGPAAGTASQGAGFSAEINGQNASLSTDAHPVPIYPNRPTTIRITVRSTDTSTLHVAAVRFEGNVMDLPLYSYDTAVGLVIPPGTSKSLLFAVDTSGIGSQATGLVGSTISLLGPGGNEITSQAVVVEVHGSLQSLYGLFGLAVLLLTASSFAFALLALARHTLPSNRWLRGVRFFIPGFGVGLVLTFTFSALEIFTPGPGRWLPLLIITCALGFAAGYLTPAPNEEVFDDYDDDVLLAQIIVVDDDPLDNETSSEPMTPQGPPPGGPDSRATIAP